DRTGGPVGRKPGAPEGFADIDIAEAGNEALVHQCRFQRSLASGEKRGQRLPVEAVAGRLKPQSREGGVTCQLLLVRQQQEAETARVIIGKPHLAASASGEADDDVIMGGALRPVAMECTGPESRVLLLD